MVEQQIAIQPHWQDLGRFLNFGRPSQVKVWRRLLESLPNQNQSGTTPTNRLCQHNKGKNDLHPQLLLETCCCLLKCLLKTAIKMYQANHCIKLASPHRLNKMTVRSSDKSCDMQNLMDRPKHDSDWCEVNVRVQIVPHGTILSHTPFAMTESAHV